ncbi:diaminopimelate epimerase [Micromonospora polyrhachis]|uniref:Diaminopimelate epimerase n=1 Tax=Micromonospora polyrhachis TaxID=1282883 RepID=A0A7W7WNL8_9ACTN|nr:diaminopimelate epimerase [Micromonospora polyrhachis]MBB4957333.1 diaminopimelate epimerase [Micromonospora polyrhachis]
MKFTKGHGTGNDFVILPDPEGQLPLTAELVAALCDRRRGIGADGVLRVVRVPHHPEAARLAASHAAAFDAASSASDAASASDTDTDTDTDTDADADAGTAEWFMDYWNADGSIAEMCGNGVRVFTRYLVDTKLAEPVDGGLPVLTRAGMVRALVREQDIAVDMRSPRLFDQGAATVDGLTLPGTAVDCGNPHLVCVLPDGVELADLDLTRAPGFDPALFPAGANVEFVTPASPVEGADLHVRMRVYERGSTETLSCGSGACAVAAVVARDAGMTAAVVAVDVPGGRLTITLDSGSCWLAGPAVLVAHGEIDPIVLSD